ncbi:MAG TPA: carboxypeptidase-like regulatory domain-containing protein [Terriglobales bacterium]|jgi:hypothetical protein|nr:carboxypeptidase-like regulatory domain-containing protein [Terriglobales bacterium]
MNRRIGLVLACMALAIPVSAMSEPGRISGVVRNATGIPQIGAVVQIFSPSLTAETVFTDASGLFESGELRPGNYQVRVTAPSYLPSLREGVSVKAGASLILNVTLNTLFEALDLMPSRRVTKDGDDWNWTLRSAANRPILRVAGNDPVVVTSSNPEHVALKAHVAFVAGADAKGFGSGGEMSTQFALEHSIFSSGMVTLGGNLGNGGGAQGVLRASYSQQTADGSLLEAAATVRRFALPANTVRDSALEAMGLRLSDTFRVGDSVELKVGSEFQTVQLLGSITAWRPFGSVNVHLSPDTVVQYQYTTTEPDTRVAKGYDSAPADLSESGPRLSLDGGRAVMERARHQEVSVSRRMGSNRFQAAVYRDELKEAALTGASYFRGGYGPGVLPDVYSGTFTYNGGDLSTQGYRLVAERQIDSRITANMTYSYGGTIDLDGGSREWSQAAFHPVKRHSLSWKLSGEMPRTHTWWIASYRWTNGQALTPVDRFNSSPGQADSNLNIFIRQPLPGSGFQGRFEALMDMRNLLAQGYVPVIGQDGQTIYLVQSARSVRGGLAFRF